MASVAAAAGRGFIHSIEVSTPFATLHPMSDMFCPSCNKETLVVTKPVYDGFTRIGEEQKCAICGHVFDPPEEPSETESAAAKKLPSIFDEDDRPEKINIFSEEENRVLCRYCKHYTVNPFRQWCGHHNKDVEATDTCDQFALKAEDKSSNSSV